MTTTTTATTTAAAAAKRFLFVMVEGGGNVSSQLGIARRLAARGHEVRVLGDAAIEPEARAAGCSFAPFATAPHHNMRSQKDDLVKDWQPGSPLAKLARVAGTLMFGPAAAYARDLMTALESFPADALAIDYLLFGALIGAEKSGLPTATLMHTPYAPPTEGVPPFGLGWRPARGWLGRLRDRVVRRLMVRTFDKQGLALVNGARTGLGLPALASVFDQLLRSARMLVLTSQRYDFTAGARLPEHVIYTGPELADPAWAAEWTSPWGDAGSEIARRPLVLVGLGTTFQDQGEATRRIIAALGQLPVRGLVTLGGVFAPGDFTVPDNVVAVRSAPHRVVMPEARVVVAHGGHGTVMKALAHGVPVLAVPLGRDQADNAVRVEVAGAGLRVKPTASVATYRKALGRLLDEPGFAAGAARMATAIAEDVAEDRAVRELEALAGRGQRRAVA